MKRPIRSARVGKMSDIIIRGSTASEELNRLKGLVRKMPFFLEHGYKPTFPRSPLFRAVLDKDGNAKTWTVFAKVFETFLFRAADYARGLHVLESHGKEFQNVLSRFVKWNRSWGFFLPPTYSIVLTRYGTGGSYNSGTGLILLKANTRGEFKRENPMHTIVHEMVHVGIEEAIVQKFKLNHEEKERVVDLLCTIALKDILDGYEIQRIGDTRIDAFFTKKTINNPVKAAQKYHLATNKTRA